MIHKNDYDDVSIPFKDDCVLNGMFLVVGIVVIALVASFIYVVIK